MIEDGYDVSTFTQVDRCFTVNKNFNLKRIIIRPLRHQLLTKAEIKELSGKNVEIWAEEESGQVSRVDRLSFINKNLSVSSNSSQPN